MNLEFADFSNAKGYEKIKFVIIIKQAILYSTWLQKVWHSIPG